MICFLVHVIFSFTERGEGELSRFIMSALYSSCFLALLFHLNITFWPSSSVTTGGRCICNRLLSWCVLRCVRVPQKQKKKKKFLGNPLSVKLIRFSFFFSEVQFPLDFWKLIFVPFLRIQPPLPSLSSTSFPSKNFFPPPWHLSYKGFSTAEKELLWSNVASAAETGWDFSTRWFAQSGPAMHHMRSIRTWSIVPVDLNAFMCMNARILASLFEITGKRCCWLGSLLSPRDSLKTNLWQCLYALSLKTHCFVFCNQKKLYFDKFRD